MSLQQLQKSLTFDEEVTLECAKSEHHHHKCRFTAMLPTDTDGTRNLVYALIQAIRESTTALGSQHMPHVHVLTAQNLWFCTSLEQCLTCMTSYLCFSFCIISEDDFCPGFCNSETHLNAMAMTFAKQSFGKVCFASQAWNCFPRHPSVLFTALRKKAVTGNHAIVFLTVFVIAPAHLGWQ
jgi:hypothetical protein